jgi:hypothetical protein
MNNANDVPEISCFSNDYHEGQLKFRQACANAGITVENHAHPTLLSPAGEPLEQNVAWFGAPKARNVLLISAGTHGLEAATGSAAIIHWIQSGHWQQLPKSTAVCIVHVVNPFGWAHLSRFNENFVDLNRNFIDHDQPYPPNPLFNEIQEIFESESMGEDHLTRSWFRFHDYLTNHEDPALVIQCATGGQYHDAKGVSYGGNKLEWSTLSLINLIESRFQDTETVAHIDWHTGLGGFGEPAYVAGLPPDSDALTLACEIWGRDVITAGGLFEAGTKTPEYSGMIHSGIVNQLTLMGKRATGTVIEFGTYANPTMNAALFTDRWLRKNCNDLHSEITRAARQTMVERFYPSAIEWRSSVLQHSSAIMSKTLTALSE